MKVLTNYSAYAMPVGTGTMNYNSVILAGCLMLTLAWWLANGMRHYPGPKVHGLQVIEGVVGM